MKRDALKLGFSLGVIAIGLHYFAFYFALAALYFIAAHAFLTVE